MPYSLHLLFLAVPFPMKIVLYQPQIPQNTGNIVRTCAATGSQLILVPPLGFRTSDRLLKRAGLDYWQGVDVTTEPDIERWLEEQPHPFYFLSSKAPKTYTEVSYKPNDILIFGAETDGLPARFAERWPDKFLTIPMAEGARCLNLSNSVAIVLYEAFRQNGFRFSP